MQTHHIQKAHTYTQNYIYIYFKSVSYKYIQMNIYTILKQKSEITLKF